MVIQCESGEYLKPELSSPENEERSSERFVVGSMLFANSVSGEESQYDFPLFSRKRTCGRTCCNSDCLRFNSEKE